MRWRAISGSRFSGVGALGDANEAALIRHCRMVAEVIPVFGFYLQPALFTGTDIVSIYIFLLPVAAVLLLSFTDFDLYALAADGKAFVVGTERGVERELEREPLDEQRLQLLQHPAGTVVQQGLDLGHRGPARRTHGQPVRADAQADGAALAALEFVTHLTAAQAHQAVGARVVPGGGLEDLGER